MSKKTQPSSWWQKPKSKWLLGIPLGGFIFFVIGAIAVAGFNTAMTVTSTDQFCSVCHGSASYFVEKELHISSHGSNRTGVIAGCKSCHIPKPLLQMTWVKSTSAMSHTMTYLFGDYPNTKEGFEGERERLAEKVWDMMRADDSKECRSCHKVERMNKEKQSRMAGNMHGRMEQMGRTCIDCHKYVAHEAPQKG